MLKLCWELQKKNPGLVLGSLTSLLVLDDIPNSRWEQAIAPMESEISDWILLLIFSYGIQMLWLFFFTHKSADCGKGLVCEFPGSHSPERLRDQGPSKVRHILDCLLSSVTPQTNTEGPFSLASGAKSVHRRKGEAATVGLSPVCKGPPEHTDPANLPFP